MDKCFPNMLKAFGSIPIPTKSPSSGRNRAHLKADRKGRVEKIEKGVDANGEPPLLGKMTHTATYGRGKGQVPGQAISVAKGLRAPVLATRGEKCMRAEM